MTYGGKWIVPSVNSGKLFPSRFCSVSYVPRVSTDFDQGGSERPAWSNGIMEL